MRDACEELRLIGEDGLTVAEGGSGKGEGRLLRVAIAQPRERLAPIEYARALTDWPSKEGWNHGWTRI
jgi:large subunit ribosomal protein L40